MVSGFLISPSDHDRTFSGDAIEIRIWSKTWAGVVGLNRFIISWFIVFSSRADRHGQQIRNSFPATRPAQRPDAARSPAQSAGLDLFRYSAASAVAAPPSLELCRSALRPSERISWTSTLNDSGIPASKVSSPRTIASYTLVRPATSSDFTVSISWSVYAAPYASSAHTSISPKRWPPNCALPPRGCCVTRLYGPGEGACLLASPR